MRCLKGKIALLIKDIEKNKQEIINKSAFIKENSALEDGNKWCLFTKPVKWSIILPVCMKKRGRPLWIFNLY